MTRFRWVGVATRFIALLVGVSLIWPGAAWPLAPMSAQRGHESTASAGSAAGVDWFEVRSRTDAFGGASFNNVGAYEFIAGVVHGALDPNDPANAGIVDLDKAPRVNGLVEYQTDVAILRPKNAATARRVLFYDVVNRGNKLALGLYFNEGSGDLAKADGAGNGFVMRQGYTIVWSGWQGDVPITGDGSRLAADFPNATNADGTPITGLSREEIVFDDPTNPGKLSLTWPAANLDRAGVTLRVKQLQTDPWREIATWTYVDERTVQIDRPADMDAGAIYEFIYTARDPKVMGIGFAAIRDLVAFLKHANADQRGSANPLNDLRGSPCEPAAAGAACPSNPATTVDVAVIEGISQSGRFVRDYLWQGFNQDRAGGRVFDAAMPLIAGSRKTWTNFRFAQPGRWSKQHEDHLQAGDQFPFTYASLTDPVGGQTDGILAHCSATNACPKVMRLDGGGEFWLARSSLIVTDGAGREVALPDNVRAYLMTGTPHGYSLTGRPTKPAPCMNPGNIVYVGSTTRALTPALVDWAARGAPPPASSFPTLGAGTLALPESQRAVGFPDLGAIKVAYTGVHNFLHLTDYSVTPPVVNFSKSYQVFVPTADVDGNDLPGVRTPDLTVPLGTSMSWNPRAPGYAEGDQCASQGSFIAFAPTAAARTQSGDPRPSVGERYSGKADYVAKVRSAARALQDQGFMLPEDVENWAKRAENQANLP